MNNFEIGSILTGTVTGIKPFGAFVALDENTQGMVHISEVAQTFVKDINDFLKIGQEVTVKILAINEDQNKITLSIKATQQKPKNSKVSRSKSNVKKDKKVEGYNLLGDKLKEALKK